MAAAKESSMSWEQKTTDVITSVLRVLIRGGILLNLIMLSAFSVWLCAQFLWHLLQYIERTLFSAPW